MCIKSMPCVQLCSQNPVTVLRPVAALEVVIVDGSCRTMLCECPATDTLDEGHSVIRIWIDTIRLALAELRDWSFSGAQI